MAERDKLINFQYSIPSFSLSLFCYHYYFAFSGDLFIFFKPLKMFFCCYFYFITYLLNQYWGTYRRRFMDLKTEGLLSIGLALQAETCTWAGQQDGWHKGNKNTLILKTKRKVRWGEMVCICYLFQQLAADCALHFKQINVFFYFFNNNKNLFSNSIR